jgi:hypothetical protein
VTNRPNVAVRLVALEFLLGHIPSAPQSNFVKSYTAKLVPSVISYL